MKSTPAKVVFLHVGAPKTGTTYLQDVLWKNRKALAADGVAYPLRQSDEHFLAALDLRRMKWAGVPRADRDGAWNRVATRARSWEGPRVVLSNELLGGASEPQARQAVESFAPAEVHVVFTARDLARQLPSDWQEQIKHMHTVTLDKFVDDLVELGIDAPRPFGEMFWGLHDAVRVLESWGATVPADRVHVVTVPPSGAPRGLLWQRFANLIGVDETRYDTDVRGANTSLGAVESELLRRVNGALGTRLGPHYDALVRRRLANGVLARRPDTARIALPGQHDGWARTRSAEIVDGIRSAGYQVVGDLGELIPRPMPGRDGFGKPEDASASELGDAAVHAIAGLLQQLRGMQDRMHRLERRLSEEREGWERRPLRQAARELLRRSRPHRP